MPETTVLVTGSNGFIGKNLCVELSRHSDVRVLCFDVEDEQRKLTGHLKAADIIFHLAGVNRPRDISEFTAGNTDLTRRIISLLSECARTPAIVLSSSSQAAKDNPYGQSKKEAEEILFAYANLTGAPVYVYRLTNVFGKWSRPNYNSVVSTFCYNIAHGLDIQISNPANELELIYVDDVVTEFVRVLYGKVTPSTGYLSVLPSYPITLGELANRIYQLRDVRTSLVMPDLSDPFTRNLQSTYLSYLDSGDFAYKLDRKSDDRGDLAELIKSPHFGQIFVSRTYGNITRGNHYHDTKVEKFCVLQGKAMIRLRHLFSDDVIEYPVSGNRWEIIDIPPGYTHHIENVSDEEMLVLFWAHATFDPMNPDTYFCEVYHDKN